MNSRVYIGLKKITFLAMISTSGLLAFSANADSVGSLRNIASGKPYVLSAQPDYYGCGKDPQKKQLTDGIHSASGKCFWLEPTTVGWLTPQTVTVDLGQDMPISGAAYSTAGGRSHVMFPKHVFVLVSSDGTTFHLAGDLVKDTKGEVPAYDDQKGERRFTYRSDMFRTHGRYVKFLPWILSPWPYCFIDELEIYGGPAEFLSHPYEGKSFAKNEIPADRLIEDGAKIRFSKDILSLRNELKKRNVPDEVKKSVNAELDKLSSELASADMNFNAETFKAVIPFNAVHRKILALHGKILAAEGFQPLTVWSSHRYSQLDLLEKPVPGSKPELAVSMMRNERRAEVLNITNAGSEPAMIRFALTGLPKCVDVRQVEYVDGAYFKVEAIALTEVPFRDGQYETTAYAGMTRQIWMTFQTGKNVAPGVYKGAIDITSDTFRESVPLVLDVNDFSLPDEPGLENAVWDYAVNLSGGITPKNQTACIGDMQDSFVNVACAHRAQSAIPSVDVVDENGHLKKPLDFSPFEQWRKIWKAKRYLIYMAVGPGSTFAGLKPGTPAFNTAVKEWGVAWDKHLAAVGVKPGTVMIHFLDEPRKEQDFAVLEKWIQPFKSGSKTVDVFCNPNYLDMNMKSAPGVLASCDVVCLMPREYVKYDRKITDFVRKLVKDGKEFLFYSCDGPTHSFDPAYFRFQPWYCYKFGAAGQQFWCYSDPGNSWNQYVQQGSVLRYSMVYLDGKSVTSTKHWEAFREGIEDYACLRTLENALKKASPAQLKKVVSSPENAVADPDKIMSGLLDEVVVRNDFFGKGRENFVWDKNNPCHLADIQRLRMIEILKKMGE